MKKTFFLYLAIIALAVSEGFLLYSNNQLKKEVVLKDRWLNHIGDRCDAAETQFSANIDDVCRIIDGKTTVKFSTFGDCKL